MLLDVVGRCGQKNLVPCVAKRVSLAEYFGEGRASLSDPRASVGLIITQVSRDAYVATRAYRAEPKGFCDGLAKGRAFLDILVPRKDFLSFHPVSLLFDPLVGFNP